MKRKLFLSVLLFFLFPGLAAAGDAATIVFESGQVIYVDNGYAEVAKAMKELESKSKDHKVIEFKIGGGTFMLNVADVVAVCRDQCSSMRLVDMRDPSRKR